MTETVFIGIGLVFLAGATYLMIKESNCEMKYLMRVWKTNELKHKIPFLFLVILMYLFSLSPVALGVLVILVKSNVLECF